MEIIKDKHKKFSLLINVVKKEQINEIKEIVNKWPYLLKLRDICGRTVMHYCSEHTSALCSEFFLTKCPELLKIQDNDGYTTLHLCIIAGNELLTRFLISKSDANYLNSCDNEMHTAIHWATVCAELECLQLLIDAGAVVSTPDIHGAYPLHYAAQMCSPHSGICIANNSKIGLSVLNKLLKYVNDVNCTDNDCRTPLLWASSAGSSDAILALINAGANVFSQDKDGLTALHCASSRGHIDCVETLLTLCGADVDQLDTNGCSPLFYSVTLGHADCTQMLIQSNSDVNRQDCKGRTPAHCGASKGQLETIKILSQNKANLWIRNIRGDLPLHEAVKSGRIELVKWLLQQMPSAINATNSFGRSSLHIAAINNNIEMCNTLIDFGADVNTVMRFKNHLITPLDAALQRGYRGVAKYLLMHGSLPSSRIGQRISPNRCVSTDQAVDSSSTLYDYGTHSAIDSSDEYKAQQQTSHSLSRNKMRSQSMRTTLPKLPSLVQKNETVLETSSSTSSFIDSGNHVRNVREFETQLERAANLKQAIITNVYVTNNTPNSHPKRVHPLKKVKKKRKSLHDNDDIKMVKTYSPSLSSSSSVMNFEENNEKSLLKIDNTLKTREFDKQECDIENIEKDDKTTPDLDLFIDDNNEKSSLKTNKNMSLTDIQQTLETENIGIKDDMITSEIKLNSDYESYELLNDDIEKLNQMTLDSNKVVNLDNILENASSHQLDNKLLNHFDQMDETEEVSNTSVSDEQQFVENEDFENELQEQKIIVNNNDGEYNKINPAIFHRNDDHNDECNNEIIQMINNDTNNEIEKTDVNSNSIAYESESNKGESNCSLSDKPNEIMEKELEDRYDDKSIVSNNLLDNEITLERNNSDKKYEDFVIDNESIEKTVSEPDSNNSIQTLSDDIVIKKDDLNKEELIDNIIESIESEEKIQETVIEISMDVINEQIFIDTNESFKKIAINNELKDNQIDRNTKTDTKDIPNNELHSDLSTNTEDKEDFGHYLNTNNKENKKENISLTESEAQKSIKFIEKESEGKNENLITEDNNKDVINRQQLAIRNEINSTFTSNEDKNTKKNQISNYPEKQNFKNENISRNGNINRISKPNTKTSKLQKLNNKVNAEDINTRQKSVSLPIVNDILEQNGKLKVKGQTKHEENLPENFNNNKDKVHNALEDKLAITNQNLNKEIVRQNRLKSMPKYTQVNSKYNNRENEKINDWKRDQQNEIKNENKGKAKLKTETKINASNKTNDRVKDKSLREDKIGLKSESTASPQSSVKSSNNNKTDDSFPNIYREKNIYSSEESIFDSSLIFEDLDSEVDFENKSYTKRPSLSPDNVHKNQNTQQMDQNQNIVKSRTKENITEHYFSPPLQHKCNSKSRCSHRLHLKKLPPNVGKIETAHIGSRVDSRIDKLYLLDIRESRSDNERKRKKIIRRQRPGSDGSIEQNTVTQRVEKNLRKFYFERELFEELRELKRFQIRSGKSNETLLVKRLADKFRKEVKAPGMSDFQGPYNYKAYEMYLYDQIRRLSSSNHGKVAYITRSTSHENIDLCAHSNAINDNILENEEKTAIIQISEINNDELIQEKIEKKSKQTDSGQLIKSNKKAIILRKLKNKEEVEKILSTLQINENTPQTYGNEIKSDFTDNAMIGVLRENETTVPVQHSMQKLNDDDSQIEQISLNGSSKSSINTIISRRSDTLNTPITHLSAYSSSINFQSNNRYKFRKNCLKPRTRVEPIESAMNRPRFKRLRMKIPHKKRIIIPLQDLRIKWRKIKETENRKLHILRKCKSIEEIKQESNFTLWYEINKSYKRFNSNKSLFSAKLKQIKNSKELNIASERFHRSLSDSALNINYFK